MGNESLARTVRDILKKKGNQVWSIQPRATVLEALELMSLKNVGAVLVVDRGRIVGIFSERDYARKGILMNRHSRETLVQEVMTRDVLCVDPDKTMDQCLALMTDKRLRHLPVLDQENIVGIVSIGDVVKEVISDQQFVISQLENYIRGG